MRSSIIISTALAAALATASPVSQMKRDAQSTNTQNNFSVTNFVFGCTVTCDWSFDITNTNEQLPGHPAVTTPVHCKGSLDNNKEFIVGSCDKISDTQQFAAYIDKDSNVLNLQYEVNVPSENPQYPGATYWFEGEKVVGAATGTNPSPPSFEVPETKAYAIA